MDPRRDGEFADDDGSDGEGLTRLEYLTLIVEGYRKNGSPVPGDLAVEWGELLFEESQRKLNAEADERERLRKLRNDPKEVALEEFWVNQRKLGRTRAAELWWEKFGIEPWDVEELKDELERQDENLKEARKGPRWKPSETKWGEAY